MKVLVIIVSYNFERWIDRCLGSLRSSEHPVDTVVIDNASQDQTLRRIKKDYPEVRLIESKTNLGFGLRPPHRKRQRQPWPRSVRRGQPVL